MLKRLGEGEDLLDQINTELKAQNLQASTAVSAPQAVGLEQQRACPDLSLLFFAIPADFAGLRLFVCVWCACVCLRAGGRA